MFKLYAEDHGVPHPALLSKPTLRADCVRYYDAFRLLGVSRRWSQVGPEPIQVSEVLALLRLGLGIEDRETTLKYVRLVQRMDQLECEHLRELARQKSSK